MKNSFIRQILLFAALFSILALANFSFWDDNPFLDTSPKVNPSQTSISSIEAFPYPLNWNLYYGNTSGPNGGTVGAIYFKGKYYLNSWNLTQVCYTLTGNGLQNIPDLNTLDSIKSPIYVGQIRDMAIAPDGSGKEFLWGGKAGNVLYKMDSTLEVKSEFTIQGALHRGIAWDPNRKGFWSCDFDNEIICRDTLGNVKGILSIGSSIPAKYGLAWDSVTSHDSAFIWAWTQSVGGSLNKLYKVHIGSGNIISEHDMGLSNSSIAGGSNIIKSNTGSYLLLNFQNTSVACYSLTASNEAGCITSFRSNNIAKPILDNTTIYDTINVKGESRTPGKIKVFLDTVIHSWVGDLSITLSHNGITDTLMSRPGTGIGSVFGSNGKNFIGTKISDDGTMTFDSITSFMQPFTSPPYYRPGTHFGMDSLARFLGTDLNGDWVLAIKDNAGGDQGSLNAWGMCFGELSVSIQENYSQIKDYHLSQNYPNPFNPSTRIEYSLTKSGFVSLKVYDITGKEIAILENRVNSAGKHFVDFNASGLSSGIYFYMIRSGEYIEVKRMILLK